MKTQISHLINGSQFQAGTNHSERSVVVEQVRNENPESITIEIKGESVVLQANWSLSRKSVTYFGEVSVATYVAFFGTFGLPIENPKAFIQINTDMTVWLTTNSKKSFYNKIENSNIEIK